MQSVTEWVKQLACFYILSNLFVSILPSSAYKKYVRTFIGVLIIMLVMNPLIAFFKNGVNFDSMLNIEMSKLQNSDTMMWMKISGSDSYSTILENYKDEIQKDIDKKAWEYALYVNDFDIEINTDSSSEDFGKITRIFVSVSECKKDDIYIEIKKINANADKDADSELSPECIKIKEYIASQYGVEEGNIKIAII